MSEPDYDLLIGRLAVHYKLLTQEKLDQALQQRKLAASALDLGAFLVAEDYIDPTVLPKLKAARARYLQKRQGSTPAAAAPAAAAPTTVPPAPASPAATQPMAPVLEAEAKPAVTQPVQPMPLPTPAPPAPPPSNPSTSALAGDDTRPAMESLIEAEPLPSLAVDSEVDIEASIEVEAPVEVEAGPSFELPPEPVPVVEPTAVVEPVLDVEPSALTPMVPGGVTLLHYDGSVTLEALLSQAITLGASDLHIHCGAPIKLRMNGELRDATPQILDRAATERLVYGLINDDLRALLARQQQVDFSHAIPNVGRFRGSAYRQQRGLDAVFRIIPLTVPTLAELGLPERLEALTDYHQGMVLLTGPAGCGKSSTMAALIELINHKRPDHIITVEDPIEYVFPSRRCVVNQRQVGPHTTSFARALRAALREDPDIIAIGELRDLETIELALTAAETGHLVLATLHTSNAIRTINRLLGVFPPEQQAQIRTMVSESLRAIVSQRLVTTADGEQRVPALEVLMVNKAVGNLIRDSKTFQIVSVMQTGANQGMCLLDFSLAELVRNGTITQDEARSQAEDPKKFP